MNIHFTVLHGVAEDACCVVYITCMNMMAADFRVERICNNEDLEFKPNKPNMEVHVIRQLHI